MSDNHADWPCKLQGSSDPKSQSLIAFFADWPCLLSQCIGNILSTHAGSQHHVSLTLMSAVGSEGLRGRSEQQLRVGSRMSEPVQGTRDSLLLQDPVEHVSVILLSVLRVTVLVFRMRLHSLKLEIWR